MYKTCWNVVEIEHAMPFSYHGYHFFLSHYPTFTPHIDDHTPKRERINLFGHTHQKTNFFTFYEFNKTIPCMYHIGVDSHNFTPVSIDDVIADINAKYKETHPSYQSPAYMMGYRTEHMELTEEEKQRKAKRQIKNEEYQTALLLAKEIVTEKLVNEALNVNHTVLPDAPSFRDIIKLISPFIFKKLQLIAPDEMQEMGDYAGKAIQHCVAQKVKEIVS